MADGTPSAEGPEVRHAAKVLKIAHLSSAAVVFTQIFGDADGIVPAGGG